MGRHMLVALECEGDAQGIMAVLRIPQPARLRRGHLVYIDYLESAPWNLRAFTESPRFLGIGTVLLAEAIRLSQELKLGGRVGLHSLPQAEAFYHKCQMTRVGVDPDYFDLTYWEYRARQAAKWLAQIGARK